MTSRCVVWLCGVRQVLGRDDSEVYGETNTFSRRDTVDCVDGLSVAVHSDVGSFTCSENMAQGRESGVA